MKNPAKAGLRPASGSRNFAASNKKIKKGYD
jgi:hypothetical protein